MRRLVLVLTAVFSATFLSFATLSAEAEPADKQYEPSDGKEASDTAPKTTAPGENTPGADSISQGSVERAPSPAAERAAARDLAEEEQLPDYSQVVDNSTKGRFAAQGWQQASGGYSHGGSYVVARSGSGAKKATFEVEIPTSNDYAVYAWWTAARNNATAARFEIATASGSHTETVNQTKDGGLWIKLGSFEMTKGERTVRVSPTGGGDVVADAVAVVRGEQAAPPEEATISGEDGDAMGTSSARLAQDRRRVGGGPIVRQARRYMGTPYKYATCTRSRMSCTCLTKKAVAPFGHRFSMGELGQWRYEPSARVRGKSNLRPGDILFFKERGRRGPITHVGVYSGRGNLIHASAYYRYKKVVESKMRYVRGYIGAIRLRAR